MTPPPPPAPAASTRGLVADQHATAVRQERLQEYFEREVLAGADFVCRHAAACRGIAEARGAGAYYEGQLSHVGPSYDLRENGVPLRVLVAPMDVGRPPSHVSMVDRSSQIAASQRAGYRGRNQHMKGTTLALRAAFGLAVDSASETVAVGGRQTPLFDCFAMANLLLCSAVDASGGSKSLGTKIAAMRSNCSPHLLETIRVLEPTLVISQGVDVGKELSRALTIERQVSDRVSEARLGGLRFAFVDLRHPSRNWFTPNQAYAVDVALPALAAGRALALEIASRTGR